ncbi:MAG: hypothetical protein J0J10_14510 [Bosea sp.]|uniref:hypothetical protein n=1 Tax=Bosea sp. (in: a-proteobacteria) TaxID=1871050 RepID=UPI001ACDD68A|nr:hypothetical protein [Bosea sp. (in: a-proteobacteria)]MBN9469975.1 hypothetical protein [Bosea sp. (in: a-proteobacteria)]
MSGPDLTYTEEGLFVTFYADTAAGEEACRELLNASDEHAARCGWSDHGEREAARKLLVDLDKEG